MSEISLYPHQVRAVRNMHNGCILYGRVGSGKSRTALAYYTLKQCGVLDPYQLVICHPKDLYIITTARKRDDMDWEKEMIPFGLKTDPNPKHNLVSNQVVVDSWNNIKKYKDVKNAFFIFDEQRVVGYGAWSKTFIHIAKSNEWILLSATPGDRWEDYIPVFIANGFYRNKTEFEREHLVYAYPYQYHKVDRYLSIQRLERLRDKVLVEMPDVRHTVQHHKDVYCNYDKHLYREVNKTRFDPFENKPIQQISSMCYILRKIQNTDPSRQTALLEIFEKHPKMIVFYNFDYELDILKGLYYGENVEIAEWNGHKHQPIPEGDSWVYLVQYTAGAEGWNCIRTDTIVFFSQNYSYKIMEQSSGRIDRLNTPYTDLYCYHLKCRSGIDQGISRALAQKKQFNERRYMKWDL